MPKKNVIYVGLNVNVYNKKPTNVYVCDYIACSLYCYITLKTKKKTETKQQTRSSKLYDRLVPLFFRPFFKTEKNVVNEETPASLNFFDRKIDAYSNRGRGREKKTQNQLTVELKNRTLLK